LLVDYTKLMPSKDAHMYLWWGL